jgi:hypothetical protein
MGFMNIEVTYIDALHWARKISRVALQIGQLVYPKNKIKTNLLETSQNAYFDVMID